MTNEHAAQRVEELRRQWRLDAALELAGEQHIDDLKPDAARQILVSVARIYREYGRWKDSAESLGAAATCGDPDPWLEAEGWVDRYWHASLGTLPVVFRKQAAVRGKLDKKLADTAATDDTAALYWASAAIRIGPHPDDAPRATNSERVRRSLRKRRMPLRRIIGFSSRDCDLSG